MVLIITKEVILDTFLEPVVTWNLPARTTVKVNNGAQYKIDHSYNNIVEMFANPHLTNATYEYRDRKKTYDTLISLYADDDSKIDFSSINYKEIIFPKHQHVGFRRTRQRVNYEESEDTLRRNPATIRTFWRSTNVDRIKPNISSNALDAKFSIPQLNYFKQLDSFWALDNFDITINSNIYEVLGDLAYVGPRRYSSWISNSFRTHEASSTTSVVSMGDFGTSGALYNRGNNSSVLEPTLYENTSFVGQDISQKKNYRFLSDEFLNRNTSIIQNPDITAPHTLGLSGDGESVDIIEDYFPENFLGLNDGSGRNKPQSNSTTPGLGGGIMRAVPFINKDYLKDKGYTSVSDITVGSGLFYKPPTNYKTETQPDSPKPEDDIITNNKSPMVPTCILAADVSMYSPRPAIQFIYNPYHSILSETGWKWNVSELCGTKPWYDTYDDYSQDLIKIAPNYSILPEFSISKHMKYYVETKNGNFNTNNYSFLTLDGAGDKLAPKHNSAKKQVIFKKEYSRDGMGAHNILSYPTASNDPSIKFIQNNAFYSYSNSDTGNSVYKHFVGLIMYWQLVHLI